MKTKFQIRTYRVEHTDDICLGTASCPEQVVPLLRAIYRDACDADREHFVVLAVNARLKILGYKVVAIGTLTSCLVAMRAIFGVAFAFSGAAGILLSHSHPSQDPSPSEPDIVLTCRALEAGDILGIALLDHLVLGSSGAPDSTWASAMPLVRPRAKYAT